MGRIIRVTDEVIDYRAWIRETFPVPSYTLSVTNQEEDDSLSSCSGSESSTLESVTGSDTVSFTHSDKWFQDGAVTHWLKLLY